MRVPIASERNSKSNVRVTGSTTITCELINKSYFVLREKNQANTKKFIEERKNVGFKQNKVPL